MTIAGAKILFLITKSNWGGAQAYAYTVARGMQEAGADVAIATGGTGKPDAPLGELATRLTDAGIRVIPLPSFMRNISIFREIRSFFEILRVLKRERPDILHVNSSKAAGLGALAGRLVGVRKIVFTAHGWPHGEPRPFWQRISIRIASWLTVSLSHTIIVLSKTEQRTAPAWLNRKKVWVIPNGIASYPLLPYSEARSTLGLSEGFWFFMIAELTKNKGVDIALQAFAKTYRTHPEARLAILGDGEEQATLRTLAATLGIERAVVFAGYVKDARQYLSAADALILSSRKEGLPFVLLQAGIARTPVIATAVGGIPELITNEETGLVIRSGSADALSEALERLIEDEDLRIRMSEHLHARIVRDFSEEEMIARTVRAYIEP